MLAQPLIERAGDAVMRVVYADSVPPPPLHPLLLFLLPCDSAQLMTCWLIVGWIFSIWWGVLIFAAGSKGGGGYSKV